MQDLEFVNREFDFFEIGLSSVTFIRKNGHRMEVKRGDKIQIVFLNDKGEFEVAELYLRKFEYSIYEKFTSNRKELQLFFAETIDGKEYKMILFRSIRKIDFMEIQGTATPDPDALIIEDVGDLSLLETEDKSSIVNAINSVKNTIGDTKELKTSDKSSVVNAINDLVETAKSLYAVNTALLSSTGYVNVSELPEDDTNNEGKIHLLKEDNIYSAYLYNDTSGVFEIQTL